MNRRALVACLTVWLALAGCGGVPFGTAAGGPRLVKVALVDVFSGSPLYAGLATALENSLRVEIDDLNAHGGLLGAHVELVTADDRFDAAQTATATRRLLADRAVRLLVGPSFAGLYLGVLPLVDQAQVPNCLTSMWADDVMPMAPFAFRAHEPDRARLPALLAYIQKSTTLRRVGLIADDSAAGQATDRALADQAGRAGLQYAGAVVAGTGDQKAQVQQMLQRGVQAVILSADPATAGRTLQAIRQANAGTRLRAFGFAGLTSYRLVSQLGDAAAGVSFVSDIQAYLSDVPESRWPPAYRAFVKTVLARYGPAPGGVEMQGVPAAADCVLEWARAVEAARDFDGVRVTHAWESLDVAPAQSVLGVRERFSPTDHDAVAGDSLFVYQWTRAADRWTLRELAGPG